MPDWQRGLVNHHLSPRISGEPCSLPARPGQVDRAGDEADVAEGLRVVAEERPGGRVDLLGQQPQSTGAATEAQVAAVVVAQRVDGHGAPAPQRSVG
jgi:hypothetical protein